MKKFSQIIPNTYWGRAIFLLFLNQFIETFLFNFVYVFSNISEILSNFEKCLFNISNNEGWLMFLFNYFTYIISRFVNVGVFEIMIVWLLVYVGFRFTRNRNFIGSDFFWISVVAFAIQYLSHIVISLSVGNLSVNVKLIFIFILSVFLAWRLFRISSSTKEESKLYFKRFFKALFKSWLFYVISFAYLVLTFVFCVNFNQ